MDKIKLPNFIVVGAAKAGTTSIYEYLNAHPNIFIPDKKECKYFSSMPTNYKGPQDDVVNKAVTKSFLEYCNLFNNVKEEKAIGDVSNDYLYFYENSINNIKKYLNEDVKIIISLRNPIERAYSHYLNLVRNNREPKATFEEAIADNDNRKKWHWVWYWSYLDVGLYNNQVQAYIDNFKYVKIILFEELTNNTEETVKDLFEFIGVDSSFKLNDYPVYNKSGYPKNKLLHNFLTKPNVIHEGIKKIAYLSGLYENIKKKKEKLFYDNLEKTKIKVETRQQLIEYFGNDVNDLEELIKKDLNHWLK